MMLSIWLDRMNLEEFEDACIEMELIHKQMKNAMEMVFAISPLLALQTRGWGSISCNSIYLLRVSEFFLLSLTCIEYLEDLSRPWQQPPSNPGAAGRLRPPGYHCYFERGVE